MTAKLLERQGRASAHWLVAASPTANAAGAPRCQLLRCMTGAGPRRTLWGNTVLRTVGDCPGARASVSPTAAASKRGHASEKPTCPCQFRSGTPCMSDRRQDNRNCGLNKVHHQEPGWGTFRRCARPALESGLNSPGLVSPVARLACLLCLLARIFMSPTLADQQDPRS